MNIRKSLISPKTPYSPNTLHDYPLLTPYLLQQSIIPISITPMLVYIRNNKLIYRKARYFTRANYTWMAVRTGPFIRLPLET